VLYITTSRKPSNRTRSFCKFLSHVLRAKYEGRGKKSVDEIFERAAQLGFRRVLVVWEANGNPARLSFLTAGRAEWKWLSPELRIRGVTMPTKLPRLPHEIRITAAPEIAELFDLPEPLGDDYVELKITADEMVFSYGKKQIGKITIKMERPA